MTILKKIWAFVRKYWMWIGAGIVLLGLLIRRGVVMGALSKLRRELAAKMDAIKSLEYARDTAVFREDIEARAEKVKEAEREITALQDRIDDLNGEHEDVLEAIDEAKNWEELEKLRQAGNAR